MYEKNKQRKEQALSEALDWWLNLSEDECTDEIEMLNVKAPFLRDQLSSHNLRNMDLHSFHQVCKKINAIYEYSRRVPNEYVGLASGRIYSIQEKTEALATQIWNERTQDEKNVVDVLHFILYQGDDELPERLWESISNPKWKIRLLGISSLGEIVGWALPDIFPPRNGRTSKALRSLGIDVRIHV